jgi:integrase/recombinase XerD
MPSNLYKRGTAYYGRFSVNGELQRVSLRTSDLGEARRRLKAIRQKAERQAFGLGDAPTWEAAVVAYSAGILDQNGVKPSTAKRYRVSLRQAAAAFKGKPLPAIERADIAVYVTGRQQAGATNATIRRDLTTVSRVLAYAAGQG